MACDGAPVEALPGRGFALQEAGPFFVRGFTRPMAAIFPDRSAKEGLVYFLTKCIVMGHVMRQPSDDIPRRSEWNLTTATLVV